MKSFAQKFSFGQRTKIKAGQSVVFLTVIILLGGLTACDRLKNILSPTGNTDGGNGEVILRLHGSNTIGAEFAPALIEDFLKKKGATNIKRIPGQPEEMIIEAVMPGESAPKKIEIKAHGSDTAVKSLAENKCDIGMLSRKMKSEEVKQLSNLGDMTARGNENVIALDGIAVVVNRNNAVSDLTLKQIAQIFTGELGDWSQVKSGASGKINVFARDDKSGTFDTFKNLVLGKDKKLVGSAKRFEDSKELVNEVSADVNGVGFVALPYITSATKAIAVSEDNLPPRRPSKATIQSREYLLHRELYFYQPQNSNNKLAREFVAFAISKEGQDVAEKSKFISQNLDTDTKNNPDDAEIQQSENIPKELAEIRKTANRFHIVYFKSGSDELDNSSLDDIEIRMSDLQDKKEVILVGFSDNVGDAAKNIMLSKNRAASVEKELNKSGVKPNVVTGFGPAAPIRSNDKPEGRDKNRRVEIYYK